MAIGNPYDPAGGAVATPINPTPTDYSALGLGGIANPGLIEPWQTPVLASQPGGGLNYPTFGEAGGIGVPGVQTPAAPTPAAPVPQAPASTAGMYQPTQTSTGYGRPASVGAGSSSGGMGPSQGGTVSPSTQHDPTGGMAASGDTQASANGGSSASNTPTNDGSGMGRAILGLASHLPMIGPVIGIGSMIADAINPPPTPAQIAAQAAVSQAMADQGNNNTQAAAGQTSGEAATTDGTTTATGAGPTSSASAPSGGDSGEGGSGNAAGGQGGQGGGSGDSGQGGGVAASGGAPGGTAGGSSGGAVGGGVGGGVGTGGPGASPGEGGDHAGGGFIPPGSLMGRSPPPDTGYISARPGEYMINEAATAKYRPIIEAINNGTYDPANPPGNPGDSDPMSNGGAPFGASQQLNPGFASPTDNDGDESGAGGQSNAQMLPGPQDPANTSPLMPFPNSMALTPDAAMQRLAGLPMDQRAAIAQVVADPTIQGALLSVLGPPFAQFIQAAQAFTPPGPGGLAAAPGIGDAGGAAPPPGGPVGGGAQNIPAPASGAPGGAVSPGPGGPMPGPANAGFGPPPPGAPPAMPHAAGGAVSSLDFRGAPAFQQGVEGMPEQPTGYYGPHAMGGPVPQMDPRHVPLPMRPPGTPPQPHQAGPTAPQQPPMRPHAWGGPVMHQDVRYMPPPYQQSAPPGVPQQMPTGLRKVGSAGTTDLGQGGHYEVPFSAPQRAAGVG